MANSTGLDDARVSFKVVLLGEGAVGKTSLLLRYVENKFNDRHIQTLQVSFNIRCGFATHVRTIVIYSWECTVTFEWRDMGLSNWCAVA